MKHYLELRNACKKGNLDLVNKLIRLENNLNGETALVYNGMIYITNEFDQLMIDSCYNANLNIIMKMIELGARCIYFALNELIRLEHFSVAKKFIELNMIIKKNPKYIFRQYENFEKYDKWLNFQEIIKEICSEFIGPDISSIISEY